MGDTGEAGQIIKEEQRHVERQEEAAAVGDSETLVEEAIEHADEQVQHATTIQMYEELLDVALRNLEMDELLPKLLGRLRGMLQLDAANILLMEPSGNELVVSAAAGRDAVERGARIPLGAGLAGRVAKERRPLAVRGVNGEAASHPVLVERAIRSILGVPIVAEGQLVGVLEAGCQLPRTFSDDEVRLLELVAERAGVAIEHARLLQRLRSERERVEEENHAKTTLIHMLTHDVKTPLTAISSNVQLLESGLLDPSQQSATLQRVRHGITRLQLMIDDFLDMTRIEANRFEPATEGIDLQPLVAEILDLFEAQAAESGVELKSNIKTLRAVADPRRMQQILANLISNAVKYSGPGSTVVIEGAETGHEVVLRVRDNGHGIEPGRLTRLGGAFAREADGTGLGLHLARLLVEQQGGSLRIDSPGLGKGSTAEIVLPAHSRSS